MAGTVTENDLANMSDEDILNLDVSKLRTKDAPTTETSTETQTEEVEAQDNAGETTDKTESTATKSEETDENTDPAPQEDQTNGTEAKSSGDGEKDTAGDANDAAKTAADKGKKDADGQSADGKPTGTAPATPADGDLKAFHAAITAPFKANGREMKVQSASEAIQLMQMGANYNKKMAALRPNLNLMKMLEKANLLSEDRINFLIDVASKKPEAISKLVQDAGIDPLDISVEKAGDYKPGNHRITREEQALDEVFESLDGQEGFDRTLTVIGKQWDEDSRALIAQNPKALQDITQHIQAGVFDAVIGKVERERTFGRLTGLSDLEAYRQVGIAMMESGELAHLTGKAAPSSQQAAPAKVVVEPKPQQADDDNRRKQRQAASPTRAAAPTSKLPANFNPLAMSDEDLLKLDISKFK